MKKICVALFALCGGQALAMPTDLMLYLPTDNAGPHMFMLNPASHTPKGAEVGYSDSYRHTVIESKRESNNDLRNIKNEIENDSRGIGFMNRIGGGVGLGLLVGYDRVRVNTKDDASNLYDDEYADESFVKKSASALFNMEITSGVRFGVSYRHVIVKNHVIGSTNAQRSNNVEVVGSLSGLTAGGYLGSGQLGFGLFYRLPARGKVKVLGEDKIHSEEGLIGAGVQYELTKEARIGLSLLKWMYERDELAATTTNLRNQQIRLNGLSSEADLHATESVFAGFDYGLNSSVTLRLAAGFEQMLFVSDPSSISADVSKQAFSVPSGRGGVQLAHGNVNLYLGGSYLIRKKARTENGTTISNNAKEYSGVGALAVNF